MIPLLNVAAVYDRGAFLVAAAVPAAGSPERAAILQPRVDAKRLPWVSTPSETNPEGVGSTRPAPRRPEVDGYPTAPPPSVRRLPEQCP
jgi:hypothetical protein